MINEQAHLITVGFPLIFRWIYRVNKAEAKEADDIASTLEKASDRKPTENNTQNDGNLSVITETWTACKFTDTGELARVINNGDSVLKIVQNIQTNVNELRLFNCSLLSYLLEQRCYSASIELL